MSLHFGFLHLKTVHADVKYRLTASNAPSVHTYVLSLVRFMRLQKRLSLYFVEFLMQWSVMAQQIKFSGAMKQAAETQPSKYRLIMRQTTQPHIGKKQQAKMARKK